MTYEWDLFTEDTPWHSIAHPAKDESKFYFVVWFILCGHVQASYANTRQIGEHVTAALDAAWTNRLVSLSQTAFFLLLGDEKTPHTKEK